MRIFFIVTFIFLFPITSWGASNCSDTTNAVFYVDFGGGSDSNNGLSTSTPWKHCPGDNGGSWHQISGSNCTLKAGDRVIFKGGVQYTGQINLTVSGSGDADSQRIIYDGDSGIYATRWASGTDKAILDGNKTVAYFFYVSANYITINNFTMRNGLYAYNGSDGTELGGGVFVYSNGGYDYINISNCTMNNPGIADGSIWVAPSGGGNPSCPDSSNCPGGCDYASGMCVYNLGGDHWNIHDNKLTDCGRIGMLLSNCSYNKVYNNTMTGRITYMIWFQISDAQTTNFMNNEVYNNTLYDHMKGYITSATCTDTIAKAKGYNCPICSGDGHGNWMFFGGCIDGCVGTWKNTRIYNNKFYNSYTIGYDQYHSTGFLQYAAETGGCFDGFYFYNNVFFNIEKLGLDFYTRQNYDSGATEGCATNVYILNNTFHTTASNINGITVGDNVCIASHYGNVTIKNNILYGVGPLIHVPYAANMSGTVAIDYNNYYGTDSDTRYFIEKCDLTNTQTYHYWNTSPSWRGLGYDAHGYGPQSNPLFKNTTIGSSFDLGLSSTSSPAYHTGQDLTSLCSNANLANLCYDKDGNPRPASGNWDIGAYEFTGTNPEILVLQLI